MFGNRDKNALSKWGAVLSAVFFLTACDDGSSNRVAAAPTQPDRPNILFVMMDDVGIDQMTSFGYGGANPPKMPNMDTVAQAGIRFRNTWAQPECSPARAAFFAGRYPTRTHIYQALGPSDLANAQLSPYETAIPQLLRKAGYENGLFGKFHLAGPEHNEAGITTPALFGWDYFYGWIGGLPESIDLLAGGAVAVATSNECGFVPGPGAGGAAFGACHFPDNSCKPVRKDEPTQDVAGLQCLKAGGILVPGGVCPAPYTKPANIDFTRYNGYYVSPLVILDGGSVERVPPQDPRSRGYRTTIETDAAVDWINSRSSGKPWMATVSYTSAHTPWQQPPAHLVPDLTTQTTVGAFDNLVCTSEGTATDVLRMQGLQNRMTQAMDTEFGRLLVETRIATRNPVDGSLNYDPKASNTIIVIIGDNGTLGMAVKSPFDASRAKGTAYQTGVWVPLIVAGPTVADPDRDVEHMVNGVDLFEFFGEVAGIDVREELPASRPIDSVGLQGYLTNASQPALRQTNFAISGLNQQANGGRNGPCVVATGTSGTCMQIATSKSVCADNSGFWWGIGHEPVDNVDHKGDDNIASYDTCAQVNQVRFDNGATTTEMYTIMPDQSVAVRDESYKLVRNTFKRFDPAERADPDGGIHDEVEYEFYEINQAKPTPLLDEAGDSKIDINGNVIPGGMVPEAEDAYFDLRNRLNRLMDSAIICEGDGNIDGVVDKADLDNWSRIYSKWGESSVYDFTSNAGGQPDGLTDGPDQDRISQKLGVTCTYPPSVY